MSEQDGGRTDPASFEILKWILMSNEIDRDGFRMSLWSGYYTSSLFAEVQERFGLHRDENNVLFSLTLYGQLTAKSICDYMGRPRNSVSRAVDRLIRRGLITATTDPADRRQVLLNVAPEGAAISRQSMQIARSLEGQMLSSLSAAERLALDTILAKLMSNAPDWMAVSRNRAVALSDAEIAPRSQTVVRKPARAPKRRANTYSPS